VFARTLYAGELGQAENQAPMVVDKSSFVCVSDKTSNGDSTLHFTTGITLRIINMNLIKMTS
jgi:hypothetical protein